MNPSECCFFNEVSTVCKTVEKYGSQQIQRLDEALIDQGVFDASAFAGGADQPALS